MISAQKKKKVKKQLSNYAGVDAYLDGAKRKISPLELEAQNVDRLEKKVLLYACVSSYYATLCVCL